MSGSVRILTWNVHGGVGLDGVRDFSRIVDHIVSINPDIVALQEVDGRDRGGRASPMRIIEDRLGHRGVSASTLTAPDGEYGQVLISRWPLVDSAILDLSVGVYEPRRAISATVNAPAGALRVVAAHLGLRFGERAEQVAALCRAIDSERPTVLMGDFNDWVRYRSAQAVLESQFAESTHLRTYPARVPLLALDRIFCRPKGLLKAARTVTSAPLLSDHLPLLAELDLNSAARKVE
jgi:endonuclease/exonuclease/phosphatase family metal-dependent hydrolase